MKFTRFLNLVLVVVLVATVLGGAALAQDEVVIVIGWEQEPPSIWPLVNMVFASAMDPLVRRDVWDFEGVDAVATPVMVTEIPSFENGRVSLNDAGNTVVSYTLREGMLWSDGTPITTADCAMAHRIWSDVTTGNFQRGLYPEVVESLEVVDDYNFVFTYNVPYVDFVTGVSASCGTFPAHVYGPILDSVGNIDSAPFLFPNGVTDLVGYGPYVFDSWAIGQQVTWVRNPNWGVNDFEKAPAVDVVIARFIPDAAQMRNSLDVGDIDLAFAIPFDLVAGYRELDGIEIWSTPGVVQDALWINMYENGNQHPALKDINVRMALVHALDREEMIATLYDPTGTVPPNYFHRNWVPDDLGTLAYDPDLANQLLDEAGWVDTNGDGVRDNGEGLSLTLRFYTTTLQLRMDFQLLMQQYWEEVGVAVQLLPVPAGVLFADFSGRGIVSTGDFDLALFALTNSPLTPDIPIYWFGCDMIQNPSGGNGYGFCDPEFDALVPLIASTVDPEQRMEYVHDAVRRLSGAQFWHGLFTRNNFYAVNTSRFDPSSMYNVGVLSSNFFNRIEFWEPAG